MITQGEVSEFRDQIAEFRARYDSEGPGTVGDQFDIGEHKMKVHLTYYQLYRQCADISETAALSFYVRE